VKTKTSKSRKLKDVQTKFYQLIILITETSYKTFLSKFNQEHDGSCITRKKIGEQEV